MGNIEIICDAIKNKKQIHAIYHGKERKFCPHCLGNKDGKLHCLGFQFAGSTSKGPIADPNSNENWRCFNVAELMNIIVKEGPWYTGENHSEPANCIDEKICEVSY